MVTPLTAKSRLAPDIQTGYSSAYVGPTLVTKQAVVVSRGTLQQTASQGHPVSLFGKTGLDLGGGFWTQKIEKVMDSYIRVSNGPKTSSWYAYEGPFGAFSSGTVPVRTDFIPVTPSATMNALGTQAIARCLPTNPLAGLGQFIGELRDLPKGVDLANWRAIVRNARQETKHFNFDTVSRKAAGEYLNHVFGWVPFINDLYDTAKVIRDHARHIKQYARNSGKDIRRTYSYPMESSSGLTVLSTNAGGTPPLNTNLYVHTGTLTQETHTSSKRYFRGAFTYFLPQIEPDDSDFEKLMKKADLAERYANKLFGLRPTPDLIYKLTPWTWALDWFTTTGSVVHNWSSFANDGLVMRYGYMMDSIEITTTYTLSGVQFVGEGPSNHVSIVRNSMKTRARASPYGFGVLPTSLSAKQWGVIAALGISRQPLSLNF
jgi:hypothetical protein